MEKIMIDDIIVANATACGKSGISIVRMSGKGCLEIGKKIFSFKNLKNEIKPRFLYLGNVDLDNNIFDKCLFVYFKAPFSYTGEDVVEFQCHGGYLVGEKIIKQCLKYGARVAEPGEFSKRAFLNGKISLDEAEGIVETINSETENQLKAGNNLAEGKLFRVVNFCQEELTNIQSEIEVNLDYPEHDIEYETKEKIKVRLIGLLNQIEKLLKTEETGRIIKEGVNVSIVGKTNAGKSSLLNALIGFEQAIVTDIEGTTRDIVCCSIEYKGIKFNYFDTAGFRKTENKIEKIGIEKAKKTIENSDLILFVLDIKNQNREEKEIFEKVKNKNYIIALNKIDDLDIEIVRKDLINKYPFLKEVKQEDLIFISAKSNKNIDILKEKIFLKTTKQEISNDFVLTNYRHIEVLKKVREILNNCIENINEVSLDCTALDTKLIWEKLGEITGNTSNELIIDKIFSKFCLGK